MIEIKNLCFSYSNTKPYLIDNLNLHIDKGNYVSVLGENGSAKSTLIKLILTLLNPLSGSINITTNNIGYVPQRMESFNSQFPITVQEILNCHRKILKLKNTKCIEDVLNITSMSDFKNSLIGSLSGGQQQKVFIARALLGNPELLILDEPSTGVDIQSMNEIYSLIKDLNLNKNITVVSIEHNLSAALNNSTQIYEMNKGVGTLYTVDDYISLTTFDMKRKAGETPDL